MLGAALGLGFTVVGFLDGRTFPGELLALFRPQYCAAALLLALLGAVARRRRVALVALVLAAANGIGLLPALLADARPDPTKPELRLLVANVWYPHSDYTPLLDLVRREQPDMIGLTELTHDWAEGVDAGLAGYPHRVLQAQPGGYGIGLYSRLPLRNARIVYPTRGWPPVARATVVSGGETFEVFVVHGPSAIRVEAARRHRRYMRGLGDLAAAAGDRALLCGDVNAAPWTKPYGDLRERGRLERDDPWRPLEWTFPVWNRLLRVPIDQCLAGSGIAVKTRVGPAIGSDHFPLLVEAASAR